jgi:hypothetical protein
VQHRDKKHNPNEIIARSWTFDLYALLAKVIIEKSRGEGSQMEQDTIENVS